MNTTMTTPNLTHPLGLQIEKHVNQKIHIEQIIPKLTDACCAIIPVLHNSSPDTKESFNWPIFTL